MFICGSHAENGTIGIVLVRKKWLLGAKDAVVGFIAVGAKDGEIPLIKKEFTIGQISFCSKGHEHVAKGGNTRIILGDGIFIAQETVVGIPMIHHEMYLGGIIDIAGASGACFNHGKNTLGILAWINVYLIGPFVGIIDLAERKKDLDLIGNDLDKDTLLEFMKDVFKGVKNVVGREMAIHGTGD
jgi:hypothetical protein